MGKPEKLFLQDNVLNILIGDTTFGKIGEITASMPHFDESDIHDILFFVGRPYYGEINVDTIDKSALIIKALEYSIENDKFLGFMALLFHDDRFKRLIDDHYDGAVHYSYSEQYRLRNQIKMVIVDEVNKILHSDGYELYSDRISDGFKIQEIIATEDELLECTDNDFRVREQLWDEISTFYLSDKDKTYSVRLPSHGDTNWYIRNSIRKGLGSLKINSLIECTYVSGEIVCTLTNLGIDKIEKDKTEREEEEKIMLNNLNNKLLNYPSELSPYIDKFRSDYPIKTKTAFIMMQFSKTPAHDNIVKEIKKALNKHDIVGLRADDKEYADDLFPNVRTYMHCCNFGIAVFERLLSDEFNPNVSLEAGYMMGLDKPVCLLKDQTLKNLQTDLVGKLYKSFDPQNISGTIESEIEKWLKDKGLSD